ncbi:MAG: type I restriction-modification system subunit M N-terminal domain-containing protein, partial [Caulobacteraceae bacterium]
MPSDLALIENQLWRAADQLRANAGILPSQYARPVLGLLFLRYADERFAQIEKRLAPAAGSRIKPGPDDYKAQGAIFLPAEARFSHLLRLPEDANLGRALS